MLLLMILPLKIFLIVVLLQLAALLESKFISLQSNSSNFNLAEALIAIAPVRVVDHGTYSDAPGTGKKSKATGSAVNDVAVAVVLGITTRAVAKSVIH